MANIKKIAQGAGSAAAGAGKGVIKIISAPYTAGPIKQNRILQLVPNFAFGGAAVGLIAVLLFGLIGKGTFAIIAGLLLGAFIGAIIGLGFSFLPAGAGKTFSITLVIVGLILGASITYGYATTGVMPTILGEAGPKIAYGLAVAGNQVSCFIPGTANFMKCLMPDAWGSETVEEPIAISVQFKTADLTYTGKDEEVRAEISVTNKPGEGEKFTIEPKCFIDNKEVKTESTGTKEGDKLAFYERDVVQSATVKCKVPANMLKDKNNVHARIELTRPVKNFVEWSFYTIQKSSLDKGGLPAEIFQSEGKTVSSIGMPYEFGIGVEESVPLTEGKHDLYIKLKKKVGFTEISELKEIKYLKVKGKGDTASLTSCEGFKSEMDYLILEDVSEEKIKEQNMQEGKIFYCEIDVSPQDVQRKVAFSAEVNYAVEFKKETGILVSTVGV